MQRRFPNTSPSKTPNRCALQQPPQSEKVTYDLVQSCMSLYAAYGEITVKRLKAYFFAVISIHYLILLTSKWSNTEIKLIGPGHPGVQIKLYTMQLWCHWFESGSQLWFYSIFHLPCLSPHCNVQQNFDVIIFTE